MCWFFHRNINDNLFAVEVLCFCRYTALNLKYRLHPLIPVYTSAVIIFEVCSKCLRRWVVLSTRNLLVCNYVALLSQALTSGSIPGFVDVVLNFDSKSLQDDNIISQAHTHGRNVVFYGDDTWIKLFPNHYMRSEGTTSFFVTDYTEVLLIIVLNQNLEFILFSLQWILPDCDCVKCLFNIFI